MSGGRGVRTLPPIQSVSLCIPIHPQLPLAFDAQFIGWILDVALLLHQMLIYLCIARSTLQPVSDGALIQPEAAR